MKKLLLLLLCGILLVSCNYTQNKAKSAAQSAKDSIEKIAFDSINKLKVDSIHKADSIKKIETENKRISAFKNSIRITSFNLSEPNSAGGCDVNFHYKNMSSKTIKYVNWDGSFKNAVGDLVTSEIGNDSSFAGKDTGPVKTGHSGGGSWDCAIYNYSAKRVIMNNVSIEYMDGSTLQISGKDLKLIGLKDKQINI